MLVVIAISGFVSWYTFFAALEASGSDAAVTAINYTSVALLVVVAFFFAKPVVWQNWLGAALVILGAYLACMTPPDATVSAETEHSVTGSLP